VLARLKHLYAQATSADRLVSCTARWWYLRRRSPGVGVAAYQVGEVDFLTVLSNFTVLNDYRSATTRKWRSSTRQLPSCKRPLVCCRRRVREMSDHDHLHLADLKEPVPVFGVPALGRANSNRATRKSRTTGTAVEVPRACGGIAETAICLRRP